MKTLDYKGKALLVLPGESTVVLICSCTSVIGTPAGITSASLSLLFLINNGIVKIFF